MPQKVLVLKNSRLLRSLFVSAVSAVSEFMKGRQIRTKRSTQKGFTLIEILIVIGIIAAVMAFGFSRIRKNENNIRAVARSMIVLSKEIRNHAKLTNSTMRLVIQFDPNKPKYWVEKSSGHEIRIDKSKEKDISDEPIKSSFQIFKTLTKKEKELPTGLLFNSLEVINQAPITDGVGFIYFTPEGFADAATLQLTDKKHYWTLIFNPLTGQADFLPEAKSLKDISR